MAVAGVILAISLSVLSQTILATAMPAVVGDLRGFDRYPSATTAYLLASTVVIPIAVRLSGICGRRVFLLLGLALSTICSIPVGGVPQDDGVGHQVETAYRTSRPR